MKELGTGIIDYFHSVLALIFGLVSIIICINPYVLRTFLYLADGVICFFVFPLITSFLAIVFGFYTIIVDADEKNSIWYTFGLFGIVEGTFSFFLFFMWLGSPFFMITLSL